MTDFETPSPVPKQGWTELGSSKAAAAVLNALQIVVSSASALSLVNWTSVFAPSIAILGMVAGAILQLGGVISSKALSITVIISAVALGVGLYTVHEEAGAAPNPPFITVRAFNDLDRDGARGTYEKFVSAADKVMVRFSPERNRAEAKLLDSSVSFNGFDAGETVTVRVCGIDKDIKTYTRNDVKYSNMYPVEFAVPATQAAQCAG